MSKPTKKWEPRYRFGGNPADAYLPNPLGENKRDSTLINKQKKQRKK